MQCKKADKQRIIQDWESKVLESIGDADYTASIFNPGDTYVDFENFKNIQDLFKVELNDNERMSEPRKL